MTAVDYSYFVTLRDEGVREIVLAVETLAGAPDTLAIERAVRVLPGVISARLNLSTLRLLVRWRGGETSAEQIVDALGEERWRVYPMEARDAASLEARQARWLLSCLAVSGFAAMNIMLLSVSVWAGNVSDITPETRDLFHWLSALIALPAAAYAGQPFFRSAMSGLRARTMTMDVPISLGILLALGMSVIETARHAAHAYFDSAMMLMFFLLCGRVLDLAMRRRVRSAATNLAALKAEVATRRDAAGIDSVVPVAALAPGDLVVVRPGDRCPVDGVVVDGRSQVDESLVTGETLPHPAGPGDAMHGGTLNHDGLLLVRVTAAGEATLIAEIGRLLDRASTSRSHYARLADRAARLYAPVVHATAALTTLGWLIAGASLHDSVIIAISVLIITCPCALALAVPAVQAVATGTLFRAGILAGNPELIERLSEIDMVIFDKTGTLTLPQPGIARRDAIAPDLLAAAGWLASASRHPVAAALARPEEGSPRPAEVREVPGLGVEALIDGLPARLGRPEFCGLEVEAERLLSVEPDATAVGFAWGGRGCVFLVRQELRTDAAATLKRLGDRGLATEILSGDRAAAVAVVARKLGVESWRAALKPADKVAIIESLGECGRHVLMVGDGINDAPALASAHVSLSPISAADITQAKADAVFLGDRLAPVADAVAIAAKARRLMRQNLGLAVVYNAIAVPLAVMGLVTPLIAALAMSGSSVIVTLNALRARRGGEA